MWGAEVQGARGQGAGGQGCKERASGSSWTHIPAVLCCVCSPGLVSVSERHSELGSQQREELPVSGRRWRASWRRQCERGLGSVAFLGQGRRGWGGMRQREQQSRDGSGGTSRVSGAGGGGMSALG